MLFVTPWQFTSIYHVHLKHQGLLRSKEQAPEVCAHNIRRNWRSMSPKHQTFHGRSMKLIIITLSGLLHFQISWETNFCPKKRQPSTRPLVAWQLGIAGKRLEVRFDRLGGGGRHHRTSEKDACGRFRQQSWGYKKSKEFFFCLKQIHVLSLKNI